MTSLFSNNHVASSLSLPEIIVFFKSLSEIAYVNCEDSKLTAEAEYAKGCKLGHIVDAEEGNEVEGANDNWHQSHGEEACIVRKFWHTFGIERTAFLWYPRHEDGKEPEEGLAYAEVPRDFWKLAILLVVSIAGESEAYEGWYEHR